MDKSFCADIFCLCDKIFWNWYPSLISKDNIYLYWLNFCVAYCDWQQPNKFALQPLLQLYCH